MSLTRGCEAPSRKLGHDRTRLTTLRITAVVVWLMCVTWSVKTAIDTADVYLVLPSIFSVWWLRFAFLPKKRSAPTLAKPVSPQWAYVAWVVGGVSIGVGFAITVLRSRSSPIPGFHLSMSVIWGLLWFFFILAVCDIRDRLRAVGLRIIDHAAQLRLSNGSEIVIRDAGLLKKVVFDPRNWLLSGVVLTDGTFIGVEQNEMERLDTELASLFQWCLGIEDEVRMVCGGPVGVRSSHRTPFTLGILGPPAFLALLLSALGVLGYGHATWTATSIVLVGIYGVINAALCLVVKPDLDATYITTQREILRMKGLKVTNRLQWSEIVEYSPTPPWTRFPLKYLSRHWGSKTLRSSAGDRMRVVRVMRFDELDREIRERIPAAPG